MKSNEEKNNNLIDLLFVLRMISTLTLFELMFFMFFAISFLYDAASTKLASKLAFNMNNVYSFLSNYLIIALLVYICGMFFNYIIIKKNNKYTKSILIGEIILLIIIMFIGFISFINL